MPALNLFEPRQRRQATKVSTRVFISYSHNDARKASELAQFLKKIGAAIYFDENDKDLQRADATGNDPSVVECIEEGLNNCTHLLGLITKDTKDSWWVPYEIGSATGRKHECAHLIDEEVEDLPAYIKAATILDNEEALRDWIPLSPELTFTDKYLITNFSANEQLSFIPKQRNKREIKFY